MSASDTDRMIERAVGLVERFLSQNITEQDTKNALIEPILEHYGWPKADLDRVRAEYRHQSHHNPVDYALLMEGRPVVLVESKALGVSLDTPKTIRQVLGYAVEQGVEWAVLTNGQRWDVYAALARASAEDKRLCSLTVGEEGFDLWMQQLTAEALKRGTLRALQAALLHHREVCDALLGLVSEPSDALVALVASKAGVPSVEVARVWGVMRPGLTFGDVPSPDALLRALVLGVDPPTPEPVVPPGHDPFAAVKPRTKPTRLVLEGVAYEVRSWREVLLRVLTHVAARYPAPYETLFDDPALQGRKRAYITRERSKTFAPREIPGGFCEFNASSTHVAYVARVALERCGVPLSAVVLEVCEL